jgi:hypothetical protein
MRRIFTYSLALACSFVTVHGYGQTLYELSNTACNYINFTGAESENFNNGSTTSLSGFFGAGWTKVIQGSNEYISIPAATEGTTYSLATRSYTTFANTLNLKFNISGSSKVSSYSIYIQTATSTTLLGTISHGANGVSGDQCLQINNWSLRNQTFRFVINFTTDAGTDGRGTLNFDNYALTNVIAAAQPLPVHFARVDVKAVNAGVGLTWNIDMQENVKGYEIQRSGDGRGFTTIGFVEASLSNSYSYVDNKPLATGFYRIKSVDNDGKYMYSIVVVFKGGQFAVPMKAYMSSKNTMTVQHNEAVSGSLLSISSADGRLVKSLVPNSGSQQTLVDLSTAKPGLYLVRFENGTGGAETLKVIKQ